MRLYICRHGQSVYNQDHILGGHSDSPLTDLGREQAKQAAIDCESLDIDIIVTSPLLRAHDTAKTIGDHIGINGESIIINDLFIERDFGALDGATWSESLEIANEPTAESAEQLIARAAEGKKYLEDNFADKTVLLVCHGAFLRALTSLYDPSKPFIDALVASPNARVMSLI